MKKWLSLLLLLAMVLSMPACKQEDKADKLTDTKPQESAPQEDPLYTTPGEEEPQPLYTIQRIDYSRYNDEAMTTGITMFYDLLQFDFSRSIYAAANEILRQAHLDFKESILGDTLDGDLEYALSAGYMLKNHVETDVSYMDEEYISVLHTVTYWMGDSASINKQAHVFSLKTGSLLTLADLLRGDPQAEDRVIQAVVDYMDSRGDIWFPNAYKQVGGMRLEDFHFYLDGGDIVIVFDTFDLTSGPEGCVEIVYPVSMDELN